MHRRATGRRSVRLNLNILSNGKVCRPLLATWSGRRAVSPQYYGQVVVSSEDMILVDLPSFHECMLLDSSGRDSNACPMGLIMMSQHPRMGQAGAQDSLISPWGWARRRADAPRTTMSSNPTPRSFSTAGVQYPWTRCDLQQPSRGWDAPSRRRELSEPDRPRLAV
ncbi:hypothetical protein C8Q77DRAFT_108307 [Trametes polyzona]|nr:hypothetical protein C8Q77DRAFT_108307 [Trametes polyzona]